MWREWVASASPCRISFPLSQEQARRVIDVVAQQAPYGKAADTLLDVSVRRAWQVDPTRVALRADWDKQLEKIVSLAATGLGAHPDDTGVGVEARLYKMLLYEAGGHFKRHRDTEKEPGMFATLIIQLPAEHTGGGLVVEHAEQGRRLSFAKDSGDVMYYTAFYADCEHTLLPVESGLRLVLVYNLVRTPAAVKRTASGAEKVSPPATVSKKWQQWQEEMADCVQTWMADPRSDTSEIVVVPLEHMYTHASFCFEDLKARDKAMVRLLQQVPRKKEFVRGDMAVAMGSPAQSSAAFLQPRVGESSASEVGVAGAGSAAATSGDSDAKDVPASHSSSSSALCVFLANLTRTGELVLDPREGYPHPYDKDVEEGAFYGTSRCIGPHGAMKDLSLDVFDRILSDLADMDGPGDDSQPPKSGSIDSVTRAGDARDGKEALHPETSDPDEDWAGDEGEDSETGEEAESKVDESIQEQDGEEDEMGDGEEVEDKYVCVHGIERDAEEEDERGEPPGVDDSVLHLFRQGETPDFEKVEPCFANECPSKEFQYYRMAAIIIPRDRVLGVLARGSLLEAVKLCRLLQMETQPLFPPLAQHCSISGPGSAEGQKVAMAAGAATTPVNNTAGKDRSVGGAIRAGGLSEELSSAIRDVLHQCGFLARSINLNWRSSWRDPQPLDLQDKRTARFLYFCSLDSLETVRKAIGLLASPKETLALSGGIPGGWTAQVSNCVIAMHGWEMVKDVIEDAIKATDRGHLGTMLNWAQLLATGEVVFELKIAYLAEKGDAKGVCMPKAPQERPNCNKLILALARQVFSLLMAIKPKGYHYMDSEIFSKAGALFLQHPSCQPLVEHLLASDWDKQAASSGCGSLWLSLFPEPNVMSTLPEASQRLFKKFTRSREAWKAEEGRE